MVDNKRLKRMGIMFIKCVKTRDFYVHSLMIIVMMAEGRSNDCLRLAQTNIVVIYVGSCSPY